MEDIIKERAQELRQDEAAAAEDAEGAFQGCVVDHMQTAMQEIQSLLRIVLTVRSWLTARCLSWIRNVLLIL